MLKTEHVDDKLSSRRPLISMGDLNRPSKSSSSRVYTYYRGVSAGVPFLWESKPGTPKHSSSNSTHNNTTSSSFFPPLNPPPCYNSRNPPPQSPVRRRRSKSFAWSKFCILVGRNKSRRPESLSPSSSSSASSAPSSPAIRPLASFRRSQSTSTKSEFDYEFYDDDKSTPVSRCFWR